MTDMSRQPLAGLRILDLSTLIAAPMASTLLADFGAEVVKVELPGVADPLRELPPHKDGAPLWWKVTNRNKRGITLDVRKPDGHALLCRMAPKFDVLVENFRPGTLERYGLSPEFLHSLNPGLIILRLTGYGQTGPLSKQPGFARIAEAFSGFTNLCGDADRPPQHAGFPVADAVGGLFGALSILIACQRRNSDPDRPGEVIDLSLFEGMFRLLEFLPIEYQQLGVVRQRSGTRSQYAGPSGVYLTRDQRWFSMSTSSQSVFERLAAAIGRRDLLEDERFATNPARVRNADELDQTISAWFSRHTLAEVASIFEQYGVSGGLVNTIEDIFNSEHFKAREAIVHLEDRQLGSVAMTNVCPKMAISPGHVRSVGPDHGEHTRAVLSELLGIDDEEIDRLYALDVL